MREGEGISQRTYAKPIGTYNSVVRARGRVGMGWVEVGKCGEGEDIYNNINNKK